MTASEAILKVLSVYSDLAVHEFHIFGCSETAISARLRELARESKVIGRIRKGTSYKEWSLVRKAEQMEFKEAV